MSWREGLSAWQQEWVEKFVRRGYATVTGISIALSVPRETVVDAFHFYGVKLFDPPITDYKAYFGYRGRGG